MLSRLARWKHFRRPGDQSVKVVATRAKWKGERPSPVESEGIPRQISMFCELPPTNAGGYSRSESARRWLACRNQSDAFRACGRLTGSSSRGQVLLSCTLPMGSPQRQIVRCSARALLASGPSRGAPPKTISLRDQAVVADRGTPPHFRFHMTHSSSWPQAVLSPKMGRDCR